MALDPIVRSLANIGDGAAVLNLANDPRLESAVQALSQNTSPINGGIIFLHIPRTGGSAFLRCLEEWYAPGNVFDTFPTEEARCYDVIQSIVSTWLETKCAALHLHVPYPVHQVLLGKWTYVTLLREPIARTVSQFNILKEAAAVSRGSFLGVASGSLMDYLRDYPQYTQNAQCKYLSSLGRFTCKVSETCAAAATDGDRDLAQRCQEIVKSHCSFVGISELWDLSLLAFSVQSGRREVPLMYDFMTTANRYEPTAEETEAIRAANQADILLYEEVRANFVDRYAPLQAYLDERKFPAFHSSKAEEAAFSALLRAGPPEPSSS